MSLQFSETLNVFYGNVFAFSVSPCLNLPGLGSHQSAN